MHLKLLYIVLLVFLANSSDTGREGGGELGLNTPVLKILEPSTMSETGFQLNWSITNPVGFNTIEVVLSEDEEMTEIVRFIELDDISAQNVIFDDLMDLINDKSLLTKDLQAAIDYMNEHELVSGELGLIGGSMGAIMALAGNGYEEVLSSVALSPTSDGVFVIFPNMTLSSVYYLVGELDIHDQQGGDFPAETNALYDLTEEPRKLNIIPGTSDHGSNLLSRDSLNTSIKEWFRALLPLEYIY